MKKSQTLIINSFKGFFRIFGPSIMLLGIIYIISRPQIVYFTKSDFADIWIYKTNDTLCLTFDNPHDVKTLQSCINSEDPIRPLFKYTQETISTLYLNPKPENILMLGLGGGTLATQLNYLLPTSKIEVVEIDPKIVNVAKKFFYFEENNMVKVHIEDGIKFANNLGDQKYDLIIIDIYDKKHELENQFSTKEFMQNLKIHLNNNGIVIINVDHNDLALYNNIIDQFEDHYFLPNKTRGTLIVSNKAMKSYEEIKNVSEQWQYVFKKMGVNEQMLLKNFETAEKAKLKSKNKEI